MKCRYIYKSNSGTIHEFENEIQLDDFLLSKIKFEELFGDLVFLVSAEALSMREKAERIAKLTKDLKKKVKGTRYIEGIEIEDYNKPYLGVTAYLNEFIDENGHPLFPIFKSEEYWKRRMDYWTDLSQDINEEYSSDTGTGVYTKEEREIIFGDLPPKRLETEEERNTWKEIIEQKWKLQGILGELIHHVLDMFFRTYHGNYNFMRPEYKNNIDAFADMIIKYTEGSDKLNKNIVKQIIQYGYELVEQIKKITETNDLKDLAFYPELKISGDLAEPRLDGIKTLVGSIDLLVIDGKGNSYVFDYKTSPKLYSDYDSAKVRTFMYQLATYNRLLLRFGFKDQYNKQYILPILFNNFHLQNRDEAILDTSKTKFTYDSISWNKGSMYENLTGTIATDDKLNERLDSFLPAVKIKDVDTDTIIERVTEDENKLFGGQVKHKTYDDEYIENILKDAKQNDELEWVYELKGGYTRKPIVAKSKEELHEKLKDVFIKIQDGNRRRATTIIEAVKEAKKLNLSSLDDEYLKNMGVIHLHDDSGDLQFLKTKLHPYLDESWVIVEDDAAKHFGCVIFKNEHTKLLDVVKITGKNLDYQIYHEKAVEGGKTVKNTRRSNLTFAFETDIVEQLKTKSKMLKANVGNIESVETLLLLNEKYSLFEGGYKIGNIQIINPYTGLGSKAPNHLLEYSYKKLREHSEIYEGIDHINDNEIEFMSLLDLAESDLKEELKKEDKQDDPLRHRDSFQSCLTILDSAEDNLTKLQKVMLLLDLLKLNYGDEITLLRSNSSSRAARLYNKLLLAAAELKGIEFNQQIQRNDKWPSFSIKKALKYGLSSSYIDNPGNLDSETLNMLTRLVTEGYQNIRTDLANEIPTVRKLVENVKKQNNFGWIVGNNKVNIFKNLIDNSFEKDLVLKKVSTVQGAEQEFLKYFLRTVNRNRYPSMSEREFDEMEASGDLKYYRLPLATASSSSEIAMNGLFKSLKNRLSKWTPSNALKELREKAEGFFSDEEVNDIDKSDTKLFEMNNKFSRCDSDEDYRLESISKKGKNYFEHDLETLLLEHMFAYKSKKHLDLIFPMLRAAMTHLKIMGEDELNRQFTPDLEYAKDYIKAVVKNLPIDENIKKMEIHALSKKLKQVASFVALAFSPVLGLYQTIQGFWVDLSLYIRKPDGTNAFSFTNFAKAFKIVYGDLFHFSQEPSKVLLLNELYAVNDMDMNTYMKNIQSSNGFFNIYDLAFKFTSRPDYYNRMTILVALMLEEGTWDAYEVENGKLVYKFEKDKRFEHLRNNKRGKEYDYEKSLYYQIINQHIREGAKNPDGTLFKINNASDKIIPLPAAHTIQEIESFKALGDLIYGYYSHEKKSLIHYTLLGSLFMQMRTYWSGKKNLYLGPGGVRVQGKWVLLKDGEGKELYYQVIDGKIRTDLPPVTENTGAPVVQWLGLWQEGILVTLSTIVQGVYDHWKSGNYDIFEVFKDVVAEKYESSEDMERAYRNNKKLLIYDISLYFFIGTLVAGALADWEKELAKESKESGDIMEGICASAANILTMSIRNSAADFAFWESIGNPTLQWTPFSFDTGSRLFKNLWNTIMGDRTFWGGVTNTFAVTKQFKPLMLNIAPLTEPKEE